jgi:hypothetical protein
MSRQTLSALFLTVAILFAVLAAGTLLPYSSDIKNDLGYDSLCPFAPWSTLLIAFLAAMSWILRRHLASKPA